MSISKEEIVWGYRLLLDREPESAVVVQEKMKCPSKGALITEFLQSEEFQAKYPDVVSSKANIWVLAETPYGFRIWVNLADTAISWSIIKNQFEPEEVAFVKKHVGKGNIFFDIGTNIGFFSMLASTLVGESGYVVGFEPLTFLCDAAKRSARENNFSNCTIHNVALAGTRGIARLVYAPGSPNWGGAFLSFDDSVLPNHACVEVPVAPLVDFAEGKRADFIKIDVEGAEYVILKNSLDYIRTSKPIIMSEIHKEQLYKVSQVSASEYISSLVKEGYSCHSILDDGSLGCEVNGNENFMLINVAFIPI